MEENTNNTAELKPEALKFSQNAKGVSVNLDKMLMNVAYDVGDNRFLIATKKGSEVLFQEFEKDSAIPSNTLAFDKNLEYKDSALQFAAYIAHINKNNKFEPASQVDNDDILRITQVADEPSKLPDFVVYSYEEVTDSQNFYKAEDVFDYTISLK